MSNTSRTLSVGALAMVALSSCSLPPREAWRQIQTEGLIPFVATQWSSDSSPAAPSKHRMMAQTAKQQAPVSLIASSPSVTPAAGTVLIGPPPPMVAGNTAPSPAMIDATSLPRAEAVPGLAGYVRTPFTNPPRLVDVRGMGAGSKVVCPFTNKPFLVPSAAADEPKVASAPAPAPAPQAPKIVAPPSLTPTPSAPANVAAMTKSQPSVPPAPAPQVKPQAPSGPANNPPGQIALTPPAKAETQEIPFGNPITGRPGFVNSPYAAKHQLVDVTGLPVGMEVKCPYTGKLFRVPPQQQAQGSIPVQNTASPEKK
jgi:hypothetical protein